MIKWLSTFLLLFTIASASFAQRNNLIIEGTTPDLYLVHTVIPKENFYSIGRMYNVSPKDIASFNNLQFESGLTVGQSLKIPMNENNFSQTGAGENRLALVPVYHPVKPKEGLYRISINYNKVSPQVLKKWNHLSSDEVTIGTPLIIGYLKVDKNESSLASEAFNTGDELSPAAKTEVTPVPQSGDVSHERLPPVKVPGKTDNSMKENKEVTAVIPAAEPGVTVNRVPSKSSVNFSGGYFRKLYADQAEKRSPVTVTGSAGIFKSTSGWQDGKYYCFNNEAAPGVIVKITDTVTNKSVYAKVLDAIPDIKQNSGLAIIISNAAAEELGAEDANFECTLSYVK